jgi:hypothetical protein
MSLWALRLAASFDAFETNAVSGAPFPGVAEKRPHIDHLGSEAPPEREETRGLLMVELSRLAPMEVRPSKELTAAA